MAVQLHFIIVRGTVDAAPKNIAVVDKGKYFHFSGVGNHVSVAAGSDTLSMGERHGAKDGKG